MLGRWPDLEICKVGPRPDRPLGRDTNGAVYCSHGDMPWRCRLCNWHCQLPQMWLLADVCCRQSRQWGSPLSRLHIRPISRRNVHNSGLYQNYLMHFSLAYTVHTLMHVFEGRRRTENYYNNTTLATLLLKCACASITCVKHTLLTECHAKWLRYFDLETSS